MLFFTIALSFLVVNLGTIPNPPINAAGASTTKSFEPSFLMPLIPLLLVGGILAIVGGPEPWQRILTAANPRKARISLITSGIVILLWGLFVIFIVSSIHDQIPNVKQHIFITYVTSSLPAWAIGGVVGLLIAAAISTADTEAFTASIILHKDMNLNFFANSKVKSITVIRGLLLTIVLISALGATKLSGLIETWGVLLNLGYIAGPLSVSIVMGRGGITKTQRRRKFWVAFILAAAAFLYIAKFVGDFFSWWALIIILFSSIPLAFPGPSSTPNEIDGSRESGP